MSRPPGEELGGAAEVVDVVEVDEVGVGVVVLNVMRTRSELFQRMGTPFTVAVVGEFRVVR